VDFSVIVCCIYMAKFNTNYININFLNVKINLHYARVYGYRLCLKENTVCFV